MVHPDNFDRLSPRQREIVGLLADGLTNQQIAERLHISTSTVRSHLRTVFATLDLHSRVKLATAAVALGVVAVEVC